MAIFLSALLHVVQAYGMAVVDEAPVFVVTSYNVSVFFKRSDAVEDKRLWASEPVWINQSDPPACAMWAHALQKAEELRSLKAVLPRTKVPPNVEEEAGGLPGLSSLSDPARWLAADSPYSGTVVASVRSGSAVRQAKACRRAADRCSQNPSQACPAGRPLSEVAPRSLQPPEQVLPDV